MMCCCLKHRNSETTHHKSIQKMIEEEHPGGGGSLALQIAHSTPSSLSLSELEVFRYLDGSCRLLFALGAQPSLSDSLLELSSNS